MKHPCIQYWYLYMYNIYAYICNLENMYVILRHFLDLDLKIEDSVKTENIATSTLIITVWIQTMFHWVFFASGQIIDFPWGQQGWKQGSLQKSRLRSRAILMNYCILSTKNPWSSSTPAQIFYWTLWPGLDRRDCKNAAGYRKSSWFT